MGGGGPEEELSTSGSKEDGASYLNTIPLFLYKMVALFFLILEVVYLLLFLAGWHHLPIRKSCQDRARLGTL